MRAHVRGPLQPVDDGVLVGTTPATFAERLLEIANDARRRRVHALNNSNPTVMLRAMAAEQWAIAQLMAGLGVDEETVIAALADGAVLQSAVLDVVFERPDVAEIIAVAFDRAGDRDSANTVRQMSSRTPVPSPSTQPEAHLQLVPHVDNDRTSR